MLNQTVQMVYVSLRPLVFRSLCLSVPSNAHTGYQQWIHNYLSDLEKTPQTLMTDVSCLNTCIQELTRILN